MNNIVIIDYGAGNIDSVYKAVKVCGGDVVVSSKAEDLESSTHLILPGVGSFDDAYKSLESTGLIPVIKEQVKKYNIPLLGICLGMQLLASYGEEGEGSIGLNLVPGKVIKMKGSALYKIPHVGWNDIKIYRESEILDGIKNHSNFYFVHSYMFCCEVKNSIVAEADYLDSGVTAIVQKDNVFGVQFHPEKSQIIGSKLLENFINL